MTSSTSARGQSQPVVRAILKKDHPNRRVALNPWRRRSCGYGIPARRDVPSSWKQWAKLPSEIARYLFKHIDSLRQVCPVDAFGAVLDLNYQHGSTAGAIPGLAITFPFPRILHGPLRRIAQKGPVHWLTSSSAISRMIRSLMRPDSRTSSAFTSTGRVIRCAPSRTLWNRSGVALMPITSGTGERPTSGDPLMNRLDKRAGVFSPSRSFPSPCASVHNHIRSESGLPSRCSRWSAKLSTSARLPVLCQQARYTELLGVQEVNIPGRRCSLRQKSCSITTKRSAGKRLTLPRSFPCSGYSALASPRSKETTRLRVRRESTRARPRVAP